MINVEIDYERIGAELAKFLERGSWDPQPWMTVVEAAEHMRASESWVRARLHQIPHVKVDGKTLINRRELDSWLTNHRR